MVNQMIEEFKKTSYYNLIFKEDTIFAFVGGSQLRKTTDERSDFDIVCITYTKPKKEEYNEYLMWNGKKVHIYYKHKDLMFNPIRYFDIMTNSSFRDLKDNNTIFYGNTDEFLDFCILNSEVLLKTGIYRFAKILRCFREIVDNKTISEQNKSKLIYQLIYLKKKLFNEPIDVVYLNKIKRIKWQPVEQLYIDMCIKDFTELDNYIKNNPLDVEEALNDLKTKYNQLI